MASQAEYASHRDFQGILAPQDQLRLRYRDDRWIRCAPNHVFDNCRFNVVFSGSISVRLALPLFDTDEASLRCPQISHRYGHHCLTCIMIGRTGSHNYICDEVCRFFVSWRTWIETLGTSAGRIWWDTHGSSYDPFRALP